jgi:hypothetical protein
MAGHGKSLVVEAKANTHLTHLEELVLTQGNEGYQLARSFLLELIKTLKGHSNAKVNTSVKWDGAPAIFAGINPENGKFFVGTKSIFNKIPKINYTPQDIIDNHGHAPGLVDKLTKALKYLPSLGIDKILQGDFMFDDGMLEVADINGEPHYRFKPNTIVYAVPVDSKLGKEIGSSKFGIVFHTSYDSLDSGASYGADVSNLKRPPGVWFDDAFFTDDTGHVTLTEEETAKVISLVQEADAVNGSINYEELPSEFLNIYINNEIRSGQFLDNPEKSFENFKLWYQSRVEKRVDGLKTEKGRMRAFEKGEEELKLFDSKKEDIINLFTVSRLLFEAKNIFISKYNNAVYNTKHFVDDGSGDLKVTNPEGYVAVDHVGNGIKFVDRLEFSRANFAMDKGFKKEVNESRMFEVFWGARGYSSKKSLQEWTTDLPTTTNTNKDLFMKLNRGTPITSLVLDASKVKESLAEAVNWALNEQEEKQVVAIYPGRFQPMGRHHFQTFQKIAKQYGLENTFVATSDVTKPGSPLTFEEKKLIMIKHGIPESQIIETKNPYAAAELLEGFNPENTVAVYLVGAKDMAEDPRFDNLDGVLKDGTPAHLRTLKDDEELLGYNQHSYVGVAPHVSIDIPGVGEMCGTSLRGCLGDASPEQFEAVMGWFDEEIYDLLQGKLQEMSSMGGGNIQGGMIGTGSKKGSRAGLDAEAFNKRQAKDARLRGAKEFIGEEDEMVNEVMNYLLGISVG